MNARPKLTILIPCYNERETILEIVDRVRKLPVDKEIVVIDNCSTDGTREILLGATRETEQRPFEPTMPGQRILQGDGFVAVMQPRNFHKGTSVKTGIAVARGEWIVCQDADLEYDPKDILRLLDHAEKHGSVAVFGSRLTDTSNMHIDAFQLGRIALTKFFRVLYWSDITDVPTCYKLMRADVAKDLDMVASGFDLDFEIAAKLRRKHIHIAELPVSYFPRDHAQGKKIRWQDGLSAVWTLIKCRVTS